MVKKIIITSTTSSKWRNVDGRNADGLTNLVWSSKEVRDWCRLNAIPSLYIRRFVYMGEAIDDIEEVPKNGWRRHKHPSGRTINIFDFSNTLLIRETDYPLVVLRFPGIEIVDEPDTSIIIKMSKK